MIKIIDAEYGCLAIQLSNGKVWFYDIGFDFAGRHSVFPFLTKVLGQHEVEGIIVSHYHFNHTHGIPEIIKVLSGKVKGIYSTGAYGDGTNKYDRDVIAQSELDEQAEKHNIPHIFVKQGDIIETSDPDVVFECWGPETEYQNPQQSHDVDQHTIYHLHVKLVYGDFSYWFTGDIRENNWWNTVNEMESNGFNAESTGYYVPHHGDYSYISEAVIDKVNPEFVHVGPYKNEQTKIWLDERNIDYHVLDEDGRVSLNAEQDGSFTLENLPGGRYGDVEQIYFGKGMTL